MLDITKVLISDKVDSSCKDILEKNGIAVDYRPGLTKDELKAIIADYDALIVRSATKVTEEIFDVATKLKLVGRAGTGVDNIDLKAASANGVLVMNTPGGNTLSAAEHTCALISAVARHVGQGYASMLAGKWERSKFMGNELMGKTLAIIGLGRIGREVASRMKGYGMKTVGYDPCVKKEDAEAWGIECLQLEEIWPLADFITVHTPLIKQTRGLINAAAFEKCKPTVRVINVARGGIIDENDLLQALNDGKCGGAGLDVFTSEPPIDVALELVQHSKVIATPHLGASTTEAQLRVAAEISEQIVDAINAKPMVGLVNAPALSQSCNPTYKPWMEVAEKLGKLTSTMLEGNPTDVEVAMVTRGSVLNPANALMTAAFSCGLAKSRGASANLINSASLLADSGIAVKSIREDVESGTSSISVNIGGSMCTGLICGGTPALSQVHGIHLVSPIALASHILIAECPASDYSSKDLMLLLASIDVTSLSMGTGDGKVVMAATHNTPNGFVIKEPFVSVVL